MFRTIRIAIILLSLGVGVGTNAQSPISTPTYYNPDQPAGQKGVDWATETVILRNNIAGNITARSITRAQGNGNKSRVVIVINGNIVNRVTSDSEEAVALTFIQGNGVYRIVTLCYAQNAETKECRLSVNREVSTILE